MNESLSDSDCVGKGSLVTPFGDQSHGGSNPLLLHDSPSLDKEASLNSTKFFTPPFSLSSKKRCAKEMLLSLSSAAEEDDPETSFCSDDLATAFVPRSLNQVKLSRDF